MGVPLSIFAVIAPAAVVAAAPPNPAYLSARSSCQEGNTSPLGAKAGLPRRRGNYGVPCAPQPGLTEGAGGVLTKVGGCGCSNNHVCVLAKW